VERVKKNGEKDAQALKLYTEAAAEFRKCITVENKNTGDAYYRLGIILYNGPSSLRNYSESVRYLYEAADIFEKEKKEVSSVYNEIGMALSRAGDFYSAFANFQKANPESTNVARLYWLGLGVRQDLPKAMELYRKDALNSRFSKSWESNYIIWTLWANVYALDWQIKEYRKGNFGDEGMALYNEYVYLTLMGEPKDVQIAKLMQAADKGYPPAQTDLNMYYQYLGWSDKKQFSKGIPYLQKAVDANYAPAFYHMGQEYYLIYGVKKDHNEAKKWFEKAAVQGHPLAQNELGHMYFNNMINAEKGYSNKELAWYWFNASAEQGFASAVQNLTVVDSYKSKFESVMGSVAGLLTDVTTVTKMAADTYTSVNKSRVQKHIPKSGQSGSLNASASSSSSSETNTNTKRACTECGQTGKCHYSAFTKMCNGGYLECNICDGKGTATYTKTETCRTCGGKGKVECGICNGSGKCQYCNGEGYI